MSAPSAASPAASAEVARPAALTSGPLRRMADGTWAMSLTEWRKLRHNQLDLVTRSVQPLLWLIVLGKAAGAATRALVQAALVMMPLFFASSALYPLAVMPGWLKGIAHVNPLTYEVEGLRSFLLGGGHPWLDLLVCSGWLVVLAAVATAAYPRALL